MCVSAYTRTCVWRLHSSARKKLTSGKPSAKGVEALVDLCNDWVRRHMGVEALVDLFPSEERPPGILILACLPIFDFLQKYYERHNILCFLLFVYLLWIYFTHIFVLVLHQWIINYIEVSYFS